MTLADGIHHFPTGPFNWYVIEEGGRLTLVDAGFPGHFSVFEQGLRSLGREMRDVEAVILTHAHADHMGFADRVGAAAKAPVFIHRHDAEAAQRPLQLPWFALLSNAWHPFMASVLTRATVNGVFSLAHVTSPRLFEDGEVLDVPGRPHVIHTPGHTPGEVAFYLPAQKVLLSGDTLVTRDLYTGRRGEPQLTRPRLNEDVNVARRSLDRLKDLGSVHMLPGHGAPWHGDMRDAVAGAVALRRFPR
jgi:glyoxylase-like metal-dependent hydrolase (beta-lactamase superfamily II)